MSSIGSRIRSRRKELGFTRQKDIAELVGVDQSTFSDFENDTHTFSAEILMRLCEHLETSAEYIMNGAAAQDGEEAQLLALFRAVDANGKRSMIALGRGLLGAKSEVAMLTPKDYPPGKSSGGEKKKGHKLTPDKKAA